MKTLETNFLNSLAAPVTTLAWFWRILRLDGVELGFTTSDRTIYINGIPYKPTYGFNPTAIASSPSGPLEPNNLDLSGLFANDGITESDLLIGKYDGALLWIFLANYSSQINIHSNPKNYFLAFAGFLGEAANNDQGFVLKVKGKKDLLGQKALNDFTSELCDYEFGDSRCGVDLGLHTYTETIASVINYQKLTILNTRDDNFYQEGKIIFSNGYSDTILNQSGATLTLINLLPFAPTVTENITIIRGCEKTRVACKRFNNILNFGGEPDLPGTDKIYAGYVG